MTQPGLKVIKPGVLTLVQDLGRFGYQDIGLSPVVLPMNRRFYGRIVYWITRPIARH